MSTSLNLHPIIAKLKNQFDALEYPYLLEENSISFNLNYINQELVQSIEANTNNSVIFATDSLKRHKYVFPNSYTEHNTIREIFALQEKWRKDPGHYYFPALVRIKIKQ